MPALPPLPPRLSGRPFGVDDRGRPLNRTKGPIVRAIVEYFLQYVGEQAAQNLPAGLTAGERQTRIESARRTALETLVRRLNLAISDPAYHITSEYLLNEGNSYSAGVNVFFVEYCREISGDPRFHFNTGAHGIPGIVHLARPLSPRSLYSLFPRFAAKVADTDFRVATVTDNSAVIEWYDTRERPHLPEALLRLFWYVACQYTQGILAAIPQILWKQPLAQVEEIRCLLNGDDHCEWRVTWQVREAR